MDERKYEAYSKYPYADFFGTVVKQEIIRFLTEHPDEDMSVVDISKQTGLPASSLSKPLNSLYESGFLESKEEGKFRYYKLKKHYATQFSDVYNSLETLHAAALRDLKNKK
jgi:DNA-binding transcriptional ArsR family regulator